MKSMTGYGEASQNVRGVKITVQLRSLNHRHLDMQLRVPREYLALEEAIRKAISDLKSGDVLLIAGKGHETGQIVGDRILPFSDHEAVAAALQGRVA